ncbi:MAG: heparinase II/III family protein [Acidobacteria bacterium]|nr:heparinase II/III family protein [Acidobacteriota bacterium]
METGNPSLVCRLLQSAADGTLDEWSVKSGLTTLAATAAKAYPGVTLKRTVTLSAGRIEDRFECASDTERTYDWAFHVAGTLTTSLKLEPQAAPLGADKGYQHVTGVARGKTGAAWLARWDAGGAILTLRFEAAPGTEVITGAGPGRDPRDKVPVVIVRRRAAKTVFAATHEGSK